MICSAFGLLFAGCSTLIADLKTNQSGNQLPEQNVANEGKGENSKPVSPEKVVQKPVVLWDYKKTEDFEDKVESRTPTISKAETKGIFTFLFGDKWDNDLTISSKVSGSFTKPNAKETLYYVGGCDEGEGFTSKCAHATMWSAGRIAIYDGPTPVTKTEADLGSEIVKITDVNGDGINEILGFYFNMGQGYAGANGSLGQIEDGKYKEIKSFSGFSDSCGTGSDQMIAKAAVIRYLPTTNGKFPIFSEEYFQNKCENSPWRKITKKQFDLGHDN